MNPSHLHLTTLAAHELDMDRRLSGPASRLDVFRHKAESEKMQHLLYGFDAENRSKQETLKYDLERQRVLAEHGAGQVPALVNVRRAVSRALISVGERIRPEAA